MGYHVYKTKDDQTTRFSCSAFTLYVEWQEGHLAHKNPISFSFVRAPAQLGYPGLKGHKTAVRCMRIMNVMLAVVLVWLTGKYNLSHFGSLL